MWENDGAHDMAHWLRMRYGISDWKARRWIASAHALESLPLTSEAFSSGRLGVDKVVELTRFATPETERVSFPGPSGSPPAPSRRRATSSPAEPGHEGRDLDADRSFDWWHDPEGANCCSRDACRQRRAGWW